VHLLSLACKGHQIRNTGKDFKSVGNLKQRLVRATKSKILKELVFVCASRLVKIFDFKELALVCGA